MLGYALSFLLLALLAGALGFGVIAGTAALIAKICFILFLILFVATLLRGKRPDRSILSAQPTNRQFISQ